MSALEKRIKSIDKHFADTESKIQQAQASVNQAIADIEKSNRTNSKLTSDVNQLNRENADLKSQLNNLQNQADRISKNSINPPTLEKLSTVEAQVSTLKKETLQERLRREYQERIDAKYKTQEQLRAEYQQRINDKFKSQTELRLQLQEEITNKQIENGFYDVDGVKFADKVGEQIDSKLSDPETTRTIKTEVINDTEVIEDITTKVTEKIETVNQEDVNLINSKLDVLTNNVPEVITPTNITLAVGASYIIQQILRNSGRLSPCQAPTLVPPVAAQARANGTATAVLQAVNTGQNAAIQNSVNAVSATANTISTNLGIVGDTVNAIRNTADIAWRATRADKLLQVLNTALIINNGFYLGRNIFETLGDAASIILDIVGIKDSEDNFIDVNEFLTNKIQQLTANLIGQENYDRINEKLKSGSRIYQSVGNMLNISRSIAASTRDIAETTGIDVAKIGNALRFSGAVDHDSYGHMSENPRGLNKYLEALEKGEDLADAINGVASETSDIIEQSKEFNEERDKFSKLIEDEQKDINRVEEVAERRLDNLPQPTQEDKLESDSLE